MSDSSQITILLVDNQNHILTTYSSLLQEMGYFNHLMAESNSEALALINNFSPDLVISAISTPGSEVTGLTLLRMVRRNDTPEKETIFILYGDNITSRELVQAGRIGANGVIRTPLSPEDFKAKIANILHPPVDAEEEQVDILYDLSATQLENGEYEEALNTCHNILDIHDSAEVYYNMGYIKGLKGDLEEALTCFRRAVTINGHHAKAYRQMGMICHQMGNEDEAHRYLATAAEIHMDRKQNNEAEEIFNTVLVLRPDTTNVYNSLGIIYRRQGRLREALEAYQKALKVHPKDEYICFNAARVHLDLGNQVESREYLRKALEINPYFAMASELLRATELGLKIKV